MPLQSDYLDAIADNRDPSWGPFIMPWPIPGNLGGMASFEKFHQWRDFIRDFGLRSGAPRIVAAKFERAQKLHVLAWLDFDVVKAGELVAFTALELALKDQYGVKVERTANHSTVFHDLVFWSFSATSLIIFTAADHCTKTTDRSYASWLRMSDRHGFISPVMNGITIDG